jgi:multidrug resistance efflux pump
MNKKTFWIIAGIAIVILLVLVIWQTTKINALASATNVAKTAASTTRTAVSSSGMVGGC